MRFDLSDDQRTIRDAVRDLASTYDSRAVRARMAGGDTGDRLWGELVKAGWPGVAVSAAHRGQGLGLVELSLVCEELGSALAPATFLGNACAAAFVEYAGSPEQWQRWLPGFASGAQPGAIAMLQPDGTALALDAGAAAALLVIGMEGVSIVPLDACALEPVDGIDVTRRLSRAVRISFSDPLPGPIDAVLDRAEVSVAAELVGVAQHALDLAVTHAKSREQFGRPVGAFQAVAQRCADMLVDVESARSAVLSAAWTADHDTEQLPFAASVAKAAAAQAAWRVASGAMQIHGGIGFTWEHDCHLLLRRATATARLLRGVDWHLERAASLRGLDAGGH